MWPWVHFPQAKESSTPQIPSIHPCLLSATTGLASEVVVAGSVDGVDLDVVPDHGGVLGRDGDAPFALELAATHYWRRV